MTIEVTAGDDLGAAELLYDISAEELVEREAAMAVIGRWVAHDGDALVGRSIAVVRPDRRMFVVLRLSVEAAFAPLLAAPADRLAGTLFVTVDREADSRIGVASELGFVPDLVSVSYDVPFAVALSELDRIRRPTCGEIVTVDEVDRDALFELDIRLRQDIPGNDGWRGERRWFDDEMASPECVPSAYVVARDPSSRELEGLCRCWRNPAGPALGMVGVVRARRQGRLAAALLVASLRAASTWGWPTFATHTARPGLQRRLRGLGAAEAGGFVRLRRP